ncbi:uncharacterized protein G2W53_013985 [Senna tora]|uniref:Uncharacterized protein n=1 Tax=Senna tora TaxID=362788 RepID=A0A834WR54_9FABA|nr:uncharacterized protein G2W53_013985 [Senna tora]
MAGDGDRRQRIDVVTPPRMHQKM